MNIYIEAEKRLAELKGWHQTQTRCEGEACWSTEADPDCNEIRFANWCRSNEAAFALMVEHNLTVKIRNTELWVETENSPLLGVSYVAIVDHPDRETAVRYAIVMAAIAKLEAAAPKEPTA